ncbi:MAG: acyltransferase [Methylacidiphilales bacterium]|nr:acyltransferase [Candidatus Methylacidiphilales bacterium]
MGIFRLALAISVLCTHLGQVHAHSNMIFGLTFLDGEVAIEAFFMISGFYMAMVLHEKYVGAGSYFIFLTQRILRLSPTYLATLLLTLTIFGVLLATGLPVLNSWRSLFFWRDHFHEMSSFSMLLMMASNLVIAGLSEIWFFGFDPQTGGLTPWFPTDPKPAFTADGFTLNPPTWSVSLEVYFYFLAPFLVRCPIRVQVAIVAASAALRYYIHDFLHWPYDPFVYRNFLCQLCFFVAGSISYQLYLCYKTEIEARSKSLRHILWVLGFLMLFYRRLPFTHLLYIIAVPVVFFLIPLLFVLTKNNPIDRFVGELSYPFYLVHFISLVLAYYLRPQLQHMWVGPYCLFFSLFLAWLIYRFVESWSERYRARLYHRQRPKVHLSPEFFPPEAIEQHRPAQG